MRGEMSMSVPFYSACLIISLITHSISQATIALEELYTNSSYAQLLKEVIIMADTVGLLDNRIDEDERYFIQDSILGKILRISRLIAHMSPDADVDKTYLTYWLDLARYGNVSSFIAHEIATLARVLEDHFKEKEQE